MDGLWAQRIEYVRDIWGTIINLTLPGKINTGAPDPLPTGASSA